MRQLLVFCAVVAVALASPQGRIVGGHAAAEGQFPHQVSVRNFDNLHLCGGWIHTARWIITAGHVLAERTISNTQVVVGTNSLSTGGFEYQLSRIIVHPNFNAYNLDNNLALLETIFEIDFYTNVRPIPLATTEITGTTTAVVAGWGHNINDGQFTDGMHWIYVSTITNEECRSRHTIVNREYVKDRMICTDNAPGVGMCVGDAGNALIAGGFVIGAVSWGYSGCGAGYPDVYTRISSQVPWINGIVNANE